MPTGALETRRAVECHPRPTSRGEDHLTTSDPKSPGGIIEEVTLNWTDLTGKKTGATALGSNKFYKAQIHDLGGSFKVVFNYGRVGQTGQTQVAMCSTLDHARRTMESKV